MLIVTWASAVVCGIAGTCLILFAAMQGERVPKAGLIYAPVVFGGLGYLTSLAFLFLFAPTKYLESESGQKWMDRVGTSSILSARIVCGILAAIVTGIFIAVLVAFLNER